MSADSPASTDSLVTAAEIARLAKVTRAAVSNWRKRYPDFPTPARGAGRTALFSWAAVEAWLDRHGKIDEPSLEVLVWQELRPAYGEDLIRGLADVAELLAAGTSDALNPGLRSLVVNFAAESSPAEVIAGLTTRFLSTAGQANGVHTSTPHLVRAIRHFAGPVAGAVFDPACGIGSLLLAFGDTPGVMLTGQEVDQPAARLASLRAELDGKRNVIVKVGDSLRDDQWPELRAGLVLCDPPVTVADWGREALLLDVRWEFGPPTRADGELAWLQHCYAHVAPGGRAIVVMPPSVAYRKSGRRIRAELVRRGVLAQVVALPAGVAASHPQPVHLWLLARPVSSKLANSSVRMVNLTDNDPDGSFEPAANQVTDVALIDLLDDEVDVTPARHVAASRADQLADYLAACEALVGRLRQLRNQLPSLTSGPGPRDGPTVKVAELARAGLVAISEGTAVSTSDQLDTSYLQGFLRSAANVKRATSGSGSFRADIRGSRIPQMSIDEQRQYGAAFRALDAFEQQLADLAKLGERTAALARDGLTHGTLRPGEPKRSH